jgi:hypothetical protein
MGSRILVLLASLLLACSAAGERVTADPATVQAPVVADAGPPPGPPDHCSVAAARIAMCAKQPVPELLKDCRDRLKGKGPGLYEECVSKLSCDEIVKSFAMNEGPLGYCFVWAYERQ